MMPTKTLHRFKTAFLTKLPSNDLYLTATLQLCLIAGIASAIWFGGPLLALGDYIPLAQAEQRMYVIALVLMLWLLKFLIVDLDTPSPYQYRDTLIQQKLLALQNRFRGALHFLKKTTVSRHGKQIRLNELPWFLLIGPSHSGKTSLLANSKINFILQRQFQPQQIKQLESSDQCDWWVTREACIIDVPGKYLSPVQIQKPRDEKITLPAIFWKFFIRLTKKFRGNSGITGLVIALPLPEIMKHADLKKYQAQVRNIFQRIHELQKYFPQNLPCQLVITKCDLLPGFAEFFSEISDDELLQNWGVLLPYPKNSEKVHDLFLHRFNALIKKLNQQLLWRLHQERNPMARPYIKDFPLQIERLKEFILDFIKHFSASQVKMTLQGVHLTSSLQPATEPEATHIDEAPNTTQRGLQLFQEPKAGSRAFFIKHLLSDALTLNLQSPQKKVALRWKRRIAFATSALTIAIAAVMLGKDFQQGINQTYSIQKILSEYQLALPQTQDPDEHLMRTITFLNSLQQAARHPDFKLDLLHIVTFYSHRSQQKANVIYYQALQSILLPELRNYLGEYLRNPVNKTPEVVYNTLKAYLMLGESGRLQADYLINTLREIAPKSTTKQEISYLVHHVTNCLNTISRPLPLDVMLVQETRNYLSSLPGFQLGYVILKNINNNNAESEINLGTTGKKKPVFTSKQVLNQIPNMFTAKSFTGIMQGQSEIAAQEAMLGNWVLGNNVTSNKTPEAMTSLTQQLRSTYINNYIDAWESLLANINLQHSNNLAETDAMIANLMNNDSPLLQLLQTLHDNTYFEPLISTSPKLQSLGLLVDKSNPTNNTLYQILNSLQNLHQYLQTVLAADNQRKAAFQLVATRMQHHESVDPITQLRLVAEKSPEPIRSWLDKISDDTWHYLLQDASHYIDTSWQEQVNHVYLADIANRYPFNPHSKREVDLKKFAHFFGNPGIVIGFYNHYLLPFVDTSSKNELHWKTIDNQKIPFSEEVLHQIQDAMKIHLAFFPNRDNKLFVQFALQPYRLDKSIKAVRFNINEKQFTDTKSSTNNPHVVSWPNKIDAKMTMVQFTMNDQQIIYRQYPGAWGWFRLVNQSFEPTSSQKSVLINISNSNPTVKYMMFTHSTSNPFLNLNLREFKLNSQLG